MADQLTSEIEVLDVGVDLELVDRPSPLARREPFGPRTLLLLASDEFLTSTKLRPPTRRAYAGVYRGFVDFLIANGGRGTVEELHFGTVNAFLEQPIEERDPKTGDVELRPARPATRARKASALRGLVKHLEASGVDVDHRVKDVSVSVGDPPPPRALSPAQAESLLAAPSGTTVRGKRDAAVLHILLKAGLRRSEVANLDVDDYAWRPGVEPDRRSEKAKRRSRRAGAAKVTAGDRLVVAASRNQTSDRVLYVRESKGDRSRMVPIDASTEEAIDTYLASKLGAAAIAAGGPLIVGLRRRRGEDAPRLTAGQIGNIVKDYGDAVVLHPGQKELSAHDLRHTFCTAVALHPTHGGIERVQALAGHVDMRTSARYITVDAEAAAESVAEVWSTGRYGARSR